MSNEFVARKGFVSLRSSSFEETVRVSGSIYSPAEAFLTASWASHSISASFAATASYVKAKDVDIFQTAIPGTSVGGLIIFEHFLSPTMSYIPNLNVVINGANANGSLLAGDIGRPGIVQLTTGTSTTGRASFNTSAAAIRFGNGSYTFETSIMLPKNSDSGNRYTLYIGFGDTQAAGDMVDGAYFQYNDANSNNWQIKAASNSVRTTTTTSIGIVGNTWTTLKVVVQDVQMAYFYVNDVLAGSINNNVPQGSGHETGIIFKIEKSTGTTARTVQIDYCKVTFT